MFSCDAILSDMLQIEKLFEQYLQFFSFTQLFKFGKAREMNRTLRCIINALSSFDGVEEVLTYFSLANASSKAFLFVTLFHHPTPCQI